MSDDDFQALFGDVEPVKSGNRIARTTSPAASQDDEANRRRRAIASGEHDDEQARISGEQSALQAEHYVSDEYVEWLSADDVLAYKRAGVQDGVYKKFRLGKYPIDGRLDLHRMTVAEARTEVNLFMREALARNSRCLLILHGKGERNADRRAVLKSYLAKWLAETSMVLAFHSAQQQHGGRGAAYVLLKKSEAMKEKTREQFGR